jgi:hypothetical protein
LPAQQQSDCQAGFYVKGLKNGNVMPIPINKIHRDILSGYQNIRDDTSFRDLDYLKKIKTNHTCPRWLTNDLRKIWK